MELLKIRHLDKPLSYKEFEIEFKSLHSDINVLCLSQDIKEIIELLNDIIYRLNLIAYSQILELNEKTF